MGAPGTAIATWIVFGMSFAAFAAEPITRSLDGSFAFWVAFSFVQILALIGYAAANLKDWACWHDGTSARRLELVQSALVGLVAGNVTYFGTYYWMPMVPGLSSITVPQVGSFILTIFGGFGGARYLTAIADALIAAVRTALKIEPSKETK